MANTPKLSSPDFWKLRHIAEAVEFIGITFPSLHCWHNPAGFIILWPWAHTGSICGQAWSIVFIQNMMDCQVCVRRKLLLPVEGYGWFSFRAEWKCLETKRDRTGCLWCRSSVRAWVRGQSSQFTGQATSQHTPLIVSAVIITETIFYVNEISLLYTVAGLCAPLERMKECSGNAFWKKTAKTLLLQRLREVDLAKRLQLVYS